MKEKIYKKFKDALIEKILENLKIIATWKCLTIFLNNSKDNKIIKFKRIHDEREKLKYITHFTVVKRYIYYGLKKVRYTIYAIR